MNHDIRDMTEEMKSLAEVIFGAAGKYRELCAAEGTNRPVIWITQESTGQTIFIADSFNSGLIKSRL